MNITAAFLLNSFFLGIGLAMDAFSVSMANGLNEPCMKKAKLHSIAATFGIFQFIMPLIGWVCVHTMVEKFRQFEKIIPWISLLLLGYIGLKMMIEGIRNKGTCGNGVPCADELTLGSLIVQGIATSIDALSVGCTIAEYDVTMALVCAAIVGLTTYILCVAGVFIGKKFGMKLSNKASIIGGAILVAIGTEIFLKGF